MYFVNPDAGLKFPPCRSPSSPAINSNTNSTTPSPTTSASNFQDSICRKKPVIPINSTSPAKPDLQSLNRSSTGLETKADEPRKPPLSNPSNPHSVTRSPSQPVFVMPSLDGFCNQLVFDGSPYGESMFSSRLFDSRQFSPSETCQQTPSTASQVYRSHSYFSLPKHYPDFDHDLHANRATPSWGLSTSTLTPSVTYSSRQTSELIHDDNQSSYSPCARSTSHSSSICSRLESRQTPSSSPYSRSGFDLMGALARVVTRPDPKIQVGPVDASAAVVVVDARQKDYPIIFASPSFSLLTGYDTSEIIGQNCRFLQKPSNTKVIKKCPAESADPSASLQIRSHIQAGREIQSSIVNYRKDGQAFINLVTVIPIAWDSSEISHFVGFQVDIVSLTNKLGIPTSLQSHIQLCEGHTSNTVTGTASQQSPSSSPKQHKTSSLPSAPSESRSGLADKATSHCYYQTVLNECRDLILAISLKGTLFYVSPSCRSILGYSEEMLLNGNISMICHPADLTGILRQLKAIGNRSHTPIDLVFRAINKQGEHFWIESQGQLHVEVGKGRKYLVVVGRRREIGPLPWQAIRSAGGLDENEFWMKLSLDGLCLFATRPVREMLFLEPADMVGKSFTQLSSLAEHASIISAIRSAYEGNEVVTLVYSLKDRTGKFIKVVGHFHPAHYSSGPRACDMPLPSSKLSNPPPVIFCQTKLLHSDEQRYKKNRSEKLVLPLCAQSSSKDNIAVSMKSDALNQFPSCNSTSRHIPNSHDDLFSRLGTTRATCWNREFNQLKGENRKLRTELSKKGLSSASRNGVFTRIKNIHSTSKTSGSPYRCRVGHRQALIQEVPAPAVDPDLSAIYLEDKTPSEFTHTFLREEQNSESSLNGFYPQS